MSWDKDYGSYGAYDDSQYYGSQGQGDTSYDMYDTSNWNQTDGYGGYYDPNAYQQSNLQVPQAPRHQPVQPPQHQHQPQKMQPGPSGPGNFLNPNLIANPIVTDMAMQYGQDLVGRGQEEIKKNLDKYVSLSQLKYYFAVDTTYVGRKIGVILFPFTRTEWSLKYNSEEPVQPKFDGNAPDLYIPTMAYVTYVLIVGYVLGLNQAFSPDQLATTASSTLVWLVLEIGLLYLTLTIMSINTTLSKWDILAFSSYKYVSMIFTVIAGLFLKSKGYYIALIYFSMALIFFLMRTLKLRIEPEVHGVLVNSKRKLYMIMFYSLMQPLFIWWMTHYLVPIETLHMPEP